MIDALKEKEQPNWLKQLEFNNGLIISDFPLKYILSESLYYPSSGRNGTPVKFLAGNFLSFIYVDYGYEKQEIMNEITEPENGFMGYKLLGIKELTKNDLTPNGWHPVMPITLPDELNRLERLRNHIQRPFAIWSIFERLNHYNKEHGPERFSLLYICGDGAATYQAIYNGNQETAEAGAIIQPGHGFGGNWTNFESENGVFSRIVLENPYGKPNILLFGGFGGAHFYAAPCWSIYNQHLCMLPERYCGVWQLSENQ